MLSTDTFLAALYVPADDLCKLAPRPRTSPYQICRRTVQFVILRERPRENFRLC